MALRALWAMAGGVRPEAGRTVGGREMAEMGVRDLSGVMGRAR